MKKVWDAEAWKHEDVRKHWQDRAHQGQAGFQPEECCGLRTPRRCLWLPWALVLPMDQPREVRAHPGHAGTRRDALAPPGGAARGAARDEPKPLRGGGGVGCPIPPPPSLGTSSPGFQRHRGHGARLGMGVKVGMGRLGCSCARRMSAGAGSEGGKAAQRRGDRCTPPRGRGAVANERSRRVGGRAMLGITVGWETEEASREKWPQPPQFGRAALCSGALGKAAGGGRQGQTRTGSEAAAGSGRSGTAVKC